MTGGDEADRTFNPLVQGSNPCGPTTDSAFAIMPLRLTTRFVREQWTGSKRPAGRTSPLVSCVVFGGLGREWLSQPSGCRWSGFRPAGGATETERTLSPVPDVQIPRRRSCRWHPRSTTFSISTDIVLNAVTPSSGASATSSSFGMSPISSSFAASRGLPFRCLREGPRGAFGSAQLGESALWLQAHRCAFLRELWT